MQEIATSRIKEVNSENSAVFLLLKNQKKLLRKSDSPNRKDPILQEFDNLEPKYRSSIEKLFSRFIYDAGAKDVFVLKDEHFNNFKKIDSKFKNRKKEGVNIYNKKTLLSTAETAILTGNKVAFVKFDINYLRLADKAGYADFTIRDLAISMNKIAEKHKDKGVTAYRTGGDTFCFLLSSRNDINQDFLKKLRQELIDDFSQNQSFYLVDESKGYILKSKTKIKDEPEEESIISAIKTGDPERILRTLASGRVPDFKDLNTPEVKNEEYGKLKKMIRDRQFPSKPGRKKETGKMLESFKLDHPELKNQTRIIDQLIYNGKSNLAEYLLSTLESYHIDPLLNEEVFQGADFFKHLQARKKLTNEKVSYFYLPWLKNMNTDAGETATDIDIKTIYEVICKKYFFKKTDNKKKPRARKDGGDFIFLTDEYPEEKIIEIDLEYKSEGMKRSFKGKIPVFIVTVDYPDKETNLSPLIDNIKSMGRNAFVNWLSDLYNPETGTPGYAEEILKYYLHNRTEDRCKEMLEAIKTMKNISKGLTDKLNTELKEVNGNNQQKIYKDFGITPLKTE